MRIQTDYRIQQRKITGKIPNFAPNLTMGEDIARYTMKPAYVWYNDTRKIISENNSPNWQKARPGFGSRELDQRGKRIIGSVNIRALNIYVLMY